MSTIHRPSNALPDFSSYEEEAAFWDTHSTEDFPDEWEPVAWEIDEVRSRFILRAEVGASSFQQVRRLASAQGISTDELTHRWVLEGLARAEENVPAGSANG